MYGDGYTRRAFVRDNPVDFITGSGRLLGYPNLHQEIGASAPTSYENVCTISAIWKDACSAIKGQP